MIFSRRFILDLVTTSAIVATCGLLVWANRDRIWPPGPRSIPPPEALVSLDGAPVKGAAAASVVLEMFSDYECPFCGRFEHDTLPAIERDYVVTGKLRLVMRQHPIESLHPRALDAAVAAVCAGRQGRFWAMHGALFADQQDLSDARITAGAQRLGLDAAAFAKCRVDDTVKQEVRAEGAQAEAWGLTGTPAFFVGRVQSDGRLKVVSVISGARPIGEFRNAIDEVLGRRQVSVLSLVSPGMGFAVAVGGGILVPWRRRRLSAARRVPAATSHEGEGRL